MTKQVVLGTTLVAMLLASAVGVVYSSHRSRQLFSEWQQLQRETYRLDEEWGRLLLEHSTWAAHDRIERLANEQLMMVAPDESSLQVVVVNAETD